MAEAGSSRPVNLSLIHALNNHRMVKVPVSSDATHDATVRDATEYWLRVKRGLGFVIVTVEIGGLTGVLWEHSVGKVVRKELGLLDGLEDFCQEVRQNDHALIMLTVDKLTPESVLGAGVFMSNGASSKCLVLEYPLVYGPDDKGLGGGGESGRLKDIQEL